MTGTADRRSVVVPGRTSCAALLGLALAGLSGCSARATTATTGECAGAGEITVAVLDGGVAPDAASRDRVVGSWAPAHLQDLPASVRGTQVAAIISAAPGDGDITGAPPAPWLLDVRVLDGHGSGAPEVVADGIDWAVTHGADIVDASFVFDDDHPVVREAVRRAIDAGVVVVAATGNTLGAAQTHPAAYEGVIGVTSVTAEGLRAPLANVSNADFAAIGVDVPTAGASAQQGVASGTSAAAAVASGVLAHCYCVQGVAPDDVVAAVQQSAASTSSSTTGDIPIISCAPTGRR